jgi:hypothetical protein
VTHYHDDAVHDDVVYERDTVTYRGSPVWVIERAVAFIFGLVQIVLLLRILLLLLAAREGNAIVAFVSNVSDFLVAPFRGILRFDEIASGVSALDVAAIVALVGWTIVELIVLALVRLGRPSTA